MKDDRVYLIHIQDCIDRIELYTVDGENSFLTSLLIQDAVMRNLQILAESTQRISSPLKLNHPEIDWQRIAAFRNVIVHNYMGIDLGQIWAIIQQDIPLLKGQIQDILHQLKGAP